MQATCHPEFVAKAKGLCRSCYEKDLRKNNPAFAARQRQNCKSWQVEHPEQAFNILRNNHLRRTYGITIADYDQMFSNQGGVCAICKRPAQGRCKNLHVDHDHQTNVIRGLLCINCNRVCGYLDNKEWLNTAQDYLSGAAKVQPNVDENVPDVRTIPVQGSPKDSAEVPVRVDLGTELNHDAINGRIRVKSVALESLKKYSDRFAADIKTSRFGGPHGF